MHVLEVTLRLVPKPKYDAMAIVGFDDIAPAGDHVAFCNTHMPHALEGMDETLFQNMHEKGKNPHQQEDLFPNGHAWLICTFGGETKDEAERKAQALIDDIRTHSTKVKGAEATADPQHSIEEIVKIREAGLGVNFKDSESAGILSGMGRFGGRSGISRQRTCANSSKR